MTKRCQRIFDNGTRCVKYVIGTEKYCEKHKQPFKHQTISIGHRKFSGHRTNQSYQDYLNSEQWKIRSKREKSFAKNLCALCHRTGELHVHHSTYVRLGNEQMGDLIVLCENCHLIFHKFYEYDGRVGYFVPKK